MTLAAGSALLPTAGAAPPPAPPFGADSRSDADAGGQLTLITGDRVLLDARGEVVRVLPAQGRESIPVSVRRDGDRLLVIPHDVRELIERGRLDIGLFDVAELNHPAYRRLAGDDLPVIVGYGDGRRSAQTRLRAAGPEVRAELPSVTGQALTLDQEDATAVWTALSQPADDDPGLLSARELRPGIETVTLDRLYQTTLDTSVPRVGAPAAWEAGYDGTGVTIAILDTGIDTRHDDLADGKILAARDFTERSAPGDRDGHGTHVASTAAGTGAASDGTYTGVAPGATLLNAKVLDDEGDGFTSEIIEGMEWAIEQGAQVINMSLGGPSRSGFDPMVESVNRLSEESGALFVVASGNNGWRPGSVDSPGVAEAALTVGAVDKEDRLAFFSSVGPSPYGSGVKPDLTAPGVGIGAAAVAGSTVAENGEPLAPGYAAISGTSMATPHVAGAAALLMQRRPDWTGEQVKAALVASSVELTGDYSAHHQGSGRVDVTRALTQSVIAEPVSLSFGAARWPQTDLPPVTEDLTYRNLGDQDVTLDLTARTLDPWGEAAPEGMFSLGAERVTVPAGGTATVEATAHPSVGGERLGTYSLFVTATGEGQTVRTAGAIHLEEEMYDLTLDLRGRDGKPATDWSVSIQRLASSQPGASAESGASAGATAAATWEASAASDQGDDSMVSLRLPAGRYLAVADSYIEDENGELTGADRHLHPLLEITEDTMVTADGRDAREMALTVFDTEATGTDISLVHERADGYGGTAFSALLLPPLSAGLRTQHLGPELADEELTALVSTGWHGGGVRYHTAHTRRGSFFTGLTEHLEQQELAEVAVRWGGPGGDRLGVAVVWPELGPGTGSLHYEEQVLRDLPSTTTEYVRADGMRWSFGLTQQSPDVDEGADASYETGLREYTAGERHDVTLNVGVFGPRFGPGDGLYREGDAVTGRLSLLADGPGNDFGWGRVDAASATLRRDGEEYWTQEGLPSSLWLALPPEETAYELTTTVQRGGLPSSEVTSTHTFTSASVSGAEPVALPLSAVRFTPKLALDSTVRAHTRLRVPVTVQGSAAHGNLASLEVRVSFDGGADWQPLPVRHGSAIVTNPAAGETVSFRAEVTDRQGNTSTQTIIDAYRTH